MSDVVEKTLASLPKFLGGTLLGVGPPSSPKHASSRGYQNFLRLVHRARSKAEEEQFVKHEIKDIKQRLSQTDTKTQQICECLCKAMYCSMLGYDMSSIFVKAATLVARETGFEKRLGYLFLSLILTDGDAAEMIMLTTSTAVKDSKSCNILEQCAGMTYICQTFIPEQMTYAMPELQYNLTHPRELVRMKAAMCYHNCIVKAPSLIPSIEGKFEQILLDKDPGVMSIGVKIYSLIVQKDPDAFPNLTENLVGILRQIIHRKLPSAYEFHNIPMPWLQIQILKTLAILGKQSERRSQQMYPILKEVLQKTNMKERIAFAVIYECVLTISSIHPHPGLLKAAAACVRRFVQSTNITLKYVGIKSLTFLVQRCPEVALEHQMTVVELLDDSDLVIQRKTLDLLYNMANPTNVQVVCDKLMDHLSRSAGNKYWQTDLVTKVIELADRFATTNQWYVDTIVRLMSTCKCQLSTDIVNKVIGVIEKGCYDNTQEVKGFQQHLVKKSVECLLKQDVSCDLIKISSWVIGECAEMMKNLPEDRVFSLVMTHLSKEALDVSTKLWLTSALTKLVCSGVLKSALVKEKLTLFQQTEKNPVLKQKMSEILQVALHGLSVSVSTISSTQVDGSKMDFTLSFLDDYVTVAMETGSQPYKPRNCRQLPSNTENSQLFKGIQNSDSPASSVTMPTRHSAGGSEASSSQKEETLNLKGVKRIWGKEGRIPSDEDHTRCETQEEGEEKDEMEKDKEKKRELASALFGGITGTSQPLTEHQELDHKASLGEGNELTSTPLPKEDTGGWRSLHHNAKEDSETPDMEDMKDHHAFSSPVLESSITHLPENTQQICESLSNENQDDISSILSANQNLELLSDDVIRSSFDDEALQGIEFNAHGKLSLYDTEIDNDGESKYDHSNIGAIRDNFDQSYTGTVRDNLYSNHDTDIIDAFKDTSYNREDGVDERPCLPGSMSNHDYQFTTTPNSDSEEVTLDSSEAVGMDKTPQHMKTLYDDYLEMDGPNT